MNAYYAIDQDRIQLEDDEARADYIRDGAAECGTSNPCLDFCPNYNVSIGICIYGCAFPYCETGRILRNK